MKKILFIIFILFFCSSVKAQEIKLIDLIMFRSLDYRIFYDHLKLTNWHYQGIQSIEGEPRKFTYNNYFYKDDPLNNSKIYAYSLNQNPIKGIYFICEDIKYFNENIIPDLQKYGFSIDLNNIKEKGTINSMEIIYVSSDDVVPFKIQISYLKENGKDIGAILIYDFK
jgi:hypothetical protein